MNDNSMSFVMSVKADRYARECGASTCEEYNARVREYESIQYKGRNPRMLEDLIKRFEKVL